MAGLFRLSVVGSGVLALAAPFALAGEPAGGAAGGAFSSGKAISVRSERARTAFDRAAYERNQYALQGWLASERVKGASQSPIVVDISREEMRRLAVDNCEECSAGASRLTVGMTKSVGAAISFANLSPGMLRRQARTLAHGAIQGTTDGGFVWSAEVQSPGATALRVHFAHFFLPPQTELYVYNDEGEAFGPYTWAGPDGSGDFWSNSVGGDTLTVQLRHYGATTPRDLHASSFMIADVGHIDPGAFIESPVANPDSNFGSNCGTVSCIEDATCYTGDNNVTQVATARDAVGVMQWISGAWIYWCSGGLIADSDTSTDIPYFLSANHCISKNKDARNLEVFWHYVSAYCGGPCYDFTQLPSTLGASVVAGNRTGDFTLLKLNSSPSSYGVAYLGWSADPVAYTNNASLYRISHPNVAPQAYSEHRVDTSAGTCTTWPRGSWIYSRDVVGAIMGGSSGSPVLNNNGLIVGQLSGSCGYNINDECDNTSNATVDGAFASYYDQVAPYLGSSGGNAPPTASFTYSCTGLDCNFDGSGSSDSDGNVVAYAWTFGDGGTASGAQVGHSYTTDGTYSVTLTVTDNDAATGSTSQSVTVSAPTGNNPPSASFTYSCTGLDCTFDGSSSSDSDGNVVAYAWTFGDSGTGTGALTSHSYALAGTYHVTLTVTDNDAATDSASQNIGVVADSCFSAGAACSDDSQCCSLKCKGKPGSRTCR